MAQRRGGSVENIRVAGDVHPSARRRHEGQARSEFEPRERGNVSADGKWLWLAARFDDVIYRFDTGSGEVAQIKVGAEPHGLTVWPQPGRYSLGHTGNLR